MTCAVLLAVMLAPALQGNPGAVSPQSPQEPEVLDFAIDAGIQEAICQEPAKLAIESLDYDPSDAVGPH